MYRFSSTCKYYLVFVFNTIPAFVAVSAALPPRQFVYLRKYKLVILLLVVSQRLFILFVIYEIQ